MTHNINVFDSVILNGNNFVSSGNNGGIWIITPDLKEYNSHNDANSTATIEENGPLKCVIKAYGQMKDINENAEGFKCHFDS